jgi:hypothetical protein
MLAGMIPGCFAPSRRFTPYPWRGRPPRLSRRVRFLILDVLLLAAMALVAVPVGISFVYALFHA